MDLQDNQDFQLLVVVVNLDRQASQGREVRRVSQVLQESPCQVHQEEQGHLVPRVCQDLLDLQAFLLQDKTVSLENLGVPVYREREGTQEKQARKVRRVTHV